MVAVRGEAAPGPQASPTAPYQPRCSLDQRNAGQYLDGLGNPVAECTYSAAEHPERIERRIDVGFDYVHAKGKFFLTLTQHRRRHRDKDSWHSIKMAVRLLGA